MRLWVVFFNLVMSFALFAHGDKDHVNLGDEARLIKESGKTYHQSLSLIRKMHPEFLNHKRDKTLREGVRTKQNSLKGCVNCHANQDKNTSQYHPVDKKDQFCSTCHQKVSVSVDCFGCHRTTPSQATINQLNKRTLVVTLPSNAAVQAKPSAVIIDKQRADYE